VAALNADYLGSMIVTEDNPRNWAVGGTDIAEAATAIDGWLAGHTLNPNKDRNVFLINLGILVSAGETETSFKTNYLYIIDAIVAKYPNAQIYLSRPWSSAQPARCNIMAGWIADIVSSRSTNALLGDDERVWLEGGDNGATNTYDGLHYSAAGHAAKVVAVRAVLGY
jgi:hypothetical protein